MPRPLLRHLARITLLAVLASPAASGQEECPATLAPDARDACFQRALAAARATHQTEAARCKATLSPFLRDQFEVAESAWQTELNAQFYRESEVVSLLLRATTWVPDLALGYMAASWETAWFPRSVEGIADQPLALAVDLATRAHAVHASIRPAALLPVKVNAHDPFVMALRRIEFESGRLLQALVVFFGQCIIGF